MLAKQLTFLGGAFLRLRGLVEGLLVGASQLLGQAQYLEDFYAFFAIRPQIRSTARPVPVPRPMVALTGWPSTTWNVSLPS